MPRFGTALNASDNFTLSHQHEPDFLPPNLISGSEPPPVPPLIGLWANATHLSPVFHEAFLSIGTVCNYDTIGEITPVNSRRFLIGQEIAFFFIVLSVMLIIS